MERLQTSGFVDLRTFLRHSKELGGNVNRYGCRSSLYMIGATEADLIPEIDEVMGVSRFIACPMWRACSPIAGYVT